VTLRAPAKLNLGLEVVRRRPDGYHDLVTIFQAVDLFDELTVTSATAFRYESDPRVLAMTDLARPILEDAAACHGWRGILRLQKRIPISAGLGGGSSDAALALRLAMHGQPVEEQRARGATIGSDVPFLVQGGTALAEGRGERLTPLATPKLWFVVVTPPIAITDKTRRLFAGLSATDFSDGHAVREIANRLVSDEIEFEATLPNAFSRQMLELPMVRSTWNALLLAAGNVTLSGAGPSIFSRHPSSTSARTAADKLTDLRASSVLVAAAIGPHRDRREIAEARAILNQRIARS
jgi:4-diphosphocytidyl-2-C-methyl-D-erythritol kinase